jgi:hypothetical protein
MNSCFLLENPYKHH